VNPLPADFFARFGLYVERDFLSREACAGLMDEMRAATAAPATVADGHGETVVETSRRTKQARVSDTAAAPIDAGLVEALPRLATHFGRRLTGMQAPQFLVYRVGDFFRPHHDDSEEPEAPDFVRQRAVSAVVFLNSDGPSEPGGFSGGSLTFFGLMDDNVSGESVGMPLACETGLLVAFPAHVVHSVSPVTAGERYTVVSWFIEDAVPSSPKAPGAT
jgi:predicted 2-oxoglutarate/Fe(II)-dependent dioxygenase YbiX